MSMVEGTSSKPPDDIGGCSCPDRLMGSFGITAS